MKKTKVQDNIHRVLSFEGQGREGASNIVLVAGRITGSIYNKMNESCYS